MFAAVEVEVEEDVADPPADHRARHDPEDDEQEVVAAQVGIGRVQDRDGHPAAGVR